MKTRSMNSDQQEAAEERRPAESVHQKRHPILDRLELNDYDFNGQSLDYEPNLEFDDTDLRQEIEEELEQLGASMLRLQVAPGSELSSSASSTTTPSNEPAQRRANCSQSPLERERERDGQRLEPDEADNVFSSPELRGHLLESPHDLLEENFEEAFKSSLFELENAAQLSELKQADERRRTAAKNSRIFAKMQAKSNKLASSFSFLKLIQAHQHEQQEKQKQKQRQAAPTDHQAAAGLGRRWRLSASAKPCRPRAEEEDGEEEEEEEEEVEEEEGSFRLFQSSL